MRFSHAAGLAAVLSGASFLNSLHGEFVMDDDVAVVKNMDLRPTTPLADLFANDFWGTPLHTEDSHKSYRPLAVLTFRWNYAFHELDVFGYHVVNVLCHVATTFLVAFAARHITTTDSAAIGTALLFGTHPIHTEAVAGVVGRAEVTSSIFFFLAFLIYVQVSRSRPATACLALAATAALAAVAMLCKETGLTILGICAVHDIAFKWLSGPKADLRYGPPSTWKGVIARTVFLVAVVIAAIVLRIRLTETNFSPTFSNVDNHLPTAGDFPVRAMSYAWLHFRYVWLLIWPVTLSCDYSFNAVGAVYSLYDVRLLAPAAMYTTVALIAYFAVRLCRPHVLSALAFGILPFVPSSNILFPVATVIGERLLYLPSFGFCALLCESLLGVSLPQPRARGDRAGLASWSWRLVAMLSVAYAGRTLLRNRDWATPLRLFTSAQLAVPDSCKAHICAAAAFNNKGMTIEALEAVEFAVAVKPDYAGAHFVMGNIFNELPKTPENEHQALHAYSMAVDTSEEDTEFKPDVLAVALNNIGTILMKKRTDRDALAQARRAFARSLQVTPGRFSAHANIAEVFAAQEQYAAAAYHYGQALKLRPHNAELWNNKGIAIYNAAMDKYGSATSVFDEVERHYQRSAECDPNFAAAHENLGRLSYHNRRYGASVQAFQACIRVAPGNANCLDGLGRALLRAGKPFTAAKALEAALSATSPPLSPSGVSRTKTNLQLAATSAPSATDTGDFTAPVTVANT